MWLVPKSCWTFLLYLDAFLAFSWIRKITENGLAPKDGAFSSFRPLGRSAVRMFSFTTTRNLELRCVLHMTSPLKLLPMFVRSIFREFCQIFPRFEEGKGRPKREEGLKRKGRLPVSTCCTFAIFYIFLFWSPFLVPPFCFRSTISAYQVTIKDASQA